MSVEDMPLAASVRLRYNSESSSPSSEQRGGDKILSRRQWSTGTGALFLLSFLWPLWKLSSGMGGAASAEAAGPVSAATVSSLAKRHYPTIKLNTGRTMPTLGLGTYMSGPGEVERAVKAALAMGYRHIDCAADYENEAEVGAALAEVFKEGKIKREEVFVTSKLWPDVQYAAPGKVRESVQKTLKDLQLGYLDLYLVHQPLIMHKVDGNSKPVRGLGWGLQDVWREMEAIYAAGLVRAIGVSNWNVQLLNDCLGYAKVPPAMNQIELHPYLPQHELRAFCAQNNVAITAFAPLGAPGTCGDMAKVPPLKNEVVLQVAQKHKRTAAQVLIRWCLEIGSVCIPKSVNPDRIKENFGALEFALDKQDLELLDKELIRYRQRFFPQDWHGVPVFF
eukprot:g2447.t1